MREYTAGKDFTYGETNSLISNLKKSVARRGRSEWHYKEYAIEKAGQELRSAIGEEMLKNFTIVPMPPSKAKSDPMYDDRLLRIVRIMTQDLSCDVRELVLQRCSMPAAHERDGTRPRPEDHYNNYYIDELVAIPPPTRILVVDDVLTAGAHFAGLKRRVQDRFPEIPIYGCFFARRRLLTAAEEFADFF